TYLDAKLTKDFCIDTDPTTGTPFPLSSCPSWDSVPSGTRLPVTPKFKGNLTARYSWGMGADTEAHVQAAYVYQSASTPALAPVWNSYLGGQPGYGIADVLAGFNKGNFAAELFINNLFDKRVDLYRFSECTAFGPLNSLFPGVPICANKPMANI